MHGASHVQNPTQPCVASILPSPSSGPVLGPARRTSRLRIKCKRGRLQPIGCTVMPLWQPPFHLRAIGHRHDTCTTHHVLVHPYLRSHVFRHGALPQQVPVSLGLLLGLVLYPRAREVYVMPVASVTTQVIQGAAQQTVDFECRWPIQSLALRCARRHVCSVTIVPSQVLVAVCCCQIHAPSVRCLRRNRHCEHLVACVCVCDIGISLCRGIIRCRIHRVHLRVCTLASPCSVYSMCMTH